MIKKEVTIKELKEALGKRVEVIAFGISYVGRLRKVIVQNGTIELADKNDVAVLEIERIEGFRHVV